jgi:hypothetical protein
MDGGVATVPNSSSTTLFGGRVPPNGFMVRVFAPGYGMFFANGNVGPICFVNDNAAAGNGVGFYMVPDIVISQGPNSSFTESNSATFASPYGYKPM